LIRLSLVVLVTLALPQATPQFHNFPPRQKANAEARVGTEPKAPKTVAPAQAETQPPATTAAVETPPPAPALPVIGCGSDPMMAKIYQLESGCNTGAYNYLGCRGLGQACPGSKLPCSDSDWTCQDNWFRNYAVERYGSIYNAYIFRINHNWW